MLNNDLFGWCLHATGRRQRADVVFESTGLWLPILCEHVVELGRQLRAAESSSTAFPFSAILEELEELSSVLTAVCFLHRKDENCHVNIDDVDAQLRYFRGWTAQCMKDIGFAFSTLVEAYMEIFDRWAGKAPEKLIQVLSSTSFILRQWCHTVSQ